MKTEFQEWIENIAHKNYSPLRDEIMSKCGVSRTTFASWMRGETSPDLDKRLTITVIAYNRDEQLPFRNMVIEHDEEGEIQVRVKQNQ